MKRPTWVILLVIFAAGIGLANFGELIPATHKLDRWAGLVETLILLALGLFGHPVVGRGAAVKFVDEAKKDGAALLLLVVGALALTGCKASPEVRAHMALTAAAEIGSAADHAVTAYDQQLQTDVVDAARETGDTTTARANLAEWRAKRTKARAAIQIYYAALLTYQVGLAQGSAGKVELVSLLSGLAKIASQLLGALRDLGVPNLPTLPNFGALPSTFMLAHAEVH